MPHIEWKLTKGQSALIDTEDVPKIEQYNWLARYEPRTLSYYAIANTKIDNKRVLLYMHRVILDLKCGDGLMVDHIDHNTLDNRKSNLRIATNKQNQQNKRDVKGYYWSAVANKWHVQLRVDMKNIHIGYFSTEESARQAYINARREYGYVPLLAN